MKSELTHLLEKLQADHPDFKALQLFRNGAAMVVGNQSSRLFADLDAVERFAYPRACETPTLYNGEMVDCLALNSKTPCWFCSHVGTPGSVEAPSFLQKTQRLPEIVDDPPRTSGFAQVIPS